MQADVLSLEGKQSREAARQVRLIVAEVLRELVHAEPAGWTPSVRDEIRRLRREAGF